MCLLRNSRLVEARGLAGDETESEVARCCRKRRTMRPRCWPSSAPESAYTTWCFKIRFTRIASLITGAALPMRKSQAPSGCGRGSRCQSEGWRLRDSLTVGWPLKRPPEILFCANVRCETRTSNRVVEVWVRWMRPPPLERRKPSQQ
jgi:hypothetical protein